MNKVLLNSWQGKAPSFEAFCRTLPDAPYLPLTGGCIPVSLSIEVYLAKIESDFEQKSGAYFSYVLDFHSSNDDADIFVLKTWQVLEPQDGSYPVIILYYAALNPYECIKKHMSEELADEYLEDRERF